MSNVSNPIDQMLADLLSLFGPAESAGTVGESVVGKIGKTIEQVLGSGLGLTSLISGVFHLFGGGDDTAVPEPLLTYTPPTAVSVSAGVGSSSTGGPFRVDYAQGNQVRPVASPSLPSSSSPAQTGVGAEATDTRWFLDHSGDIALAVRQAMLESNVLSDVIREA